MEADKDATKGDSEKRTVRKSRKASPGSAPQADLKAAAEGTDQARPGPAETPAGATTPPPSSSAEPTPEAAPAAVETVILEQSPKPATLTAQPSSEGERHPFEDLTFEQIQLRAYFISERRRNAGLAGDDQSVWIQAREELINELKGH